MRHSILITRKDSDRDKLETKYAENGTYKLYINAPFLGVTCDTCGHVDKQIVRLDPKTHIIKDMYCLRGDEEIHHDKVAVEWPED